MKPCNVIWVLTAAGSLLFFPTVGYPWNLGYEVLDRDTYEAKGGEGDADKFATYSPFPKAWAYAKIEDPEENTWAGAYAYEDGKYYIINYNGEDLTAYVSCDCEVIAIAGGMREESDYYMQASAEGHAGPYSAYACVEATEPDDGDVDSDAFYEEEIDMSYSGATVYTSELAYTFVEAYSTESIVHVYAYADSEVSCFVEENP